MVNNDNLWDTLKQRGIGKNVRDVCIHHNQEG